MRRTHLRHHDNILKRLLIHIGAFNLSLLLRKATGKGTPRRMWDTLKTTSQALARASRRIIRATRDHLRTTNTISNVPTPKRMNPVVIRFVQALRRSSAEKKPFTTGC